MANAGIAITPAVLAKVGIPAPAIIAATSEGAGAGNADGADGPHRDDARHSFSSAEIDDLCSITDGSLVLESAGDGGGAVACWPNLDPQRSLTRIGTGADVEARADAPAVRALAGPLRLLINQATDAGGFDARLEREIRDWSLALGREWSPLSALCVRLRAAKDGALRRAEGRAVDGDALVASLHAYVAAADGAEAALCEVDTTMEWSETAERVLGGAVDAWALSVAARREVEQCVK